MGSLASSNDHVSCTESECNILSQPVRLSSVFITFQWYGSNNFPLAKAGLEIHQLREFLPWLDRSTGRSGKETSLLYANKLCWNSLEGGHYDVQNYQRISQRDASLIFDEDEDFDEVPSVISDRNQFVFWKKDFCLSCV